MTTNGAKIFFLGFSLLLGGCSTSGNMAPTVAPSASEDGFSLMQQACAAIRNGAVFEGFVANLEPMWKDANELATKAAAREPAYSELSDAVHDYYMAIYSAQNMNSTRFEIFAENSTYLSREKQFTISDQLSVIIQQCPGFN
jgi:hypothetical protein